MFKFNLKMKNQKIPILNHDKNNIFNFLDEQEISSLW